MKTSSSVLFILFFCVVFLHVESRAKNQRYLEFKRIGNMTSRGPIAEGSSRLPVDHLSLGVTAADSVNVGASILSYGTVLPMQSYALPLVKRNGSQSEKLLENM